MRAECSNSEDGTEAEFNGPALPGRDSILVREQKMQVISTHPVALSHSIEALAEWFSAEALQSCDPVDRAVRLSHKYLIVEFHREVARINQRLGIRNCDCASSICCREIASVLDAARGIFSCLRDMQAERFAQ